MTLVLSAEISKLSENLLAASYGRSENLKGTRAAMLAILTLVQALVLAVVVLLLSASDQRAANAQEPVATTSGVGEGIIGAWGENYVGQLGIVKKTYSESTPNQVLGTSGAKDVVVGYRHNLALMDDGTVWEWGANSSTPVQVSGLSGVTNVAADRYHSLAVKNDGTVWAWGNNGSGQLGDGTTTNSSTPVQVSGLSGVKGVAGGYHHSLAVKNDGTVWAWGRNWEGQLGNGTTTNSSTPVRVRGLSEATAVAAGSYHSIALLAIDILKPQVAGGVTPSSVSGVARNTNVDAKFSENMNPSTLNTSTFKLFKVNADGTSTLVTNVTVTPNSDGRSATLNPFGTSSTLLAPNTKYKAQVTTQSKDLVGNQLDQNPMVSGNQAKTWTFTTGSS